VTQVGDLTARVRRIVASFAAWHPEWWMLAVSALAWFYLLFPCSTVGSVCITTTASGDRLGTHVPAHNLSGWLIMVLAMMFPLIIIPVRRTAFGSLWYRRHWAIVVFLAGYLTIWVIAGIGRLLAAAFLGGTPALGNRWVIGASFLAAAAWQMTPLKRRFAAACNRIEPLAPRGWPAHRDCLRFGADHGIRCLGNCGFMMMAAMFSPWQPATMVVTTLLLLYERYRARRRARVVPLTLGLLAVGHLIW
jgi:predicted metal-binding membrane protein